MMLEVNVRRIRRIEKVCLCPDGIWYFAAGTGRYVNLEEEKRICSVVFLNMDDAQSSHGQQSGFQFETKRKLVCEDDEHRFLLCVVVR